MSRIALLVAIALWTGLAPDSAAACSVCYAGAEESRKAFLLTTVFLSVLPLAMFGGLFWWFRRRLREADQTQIASRPSIAIPVGAHAGTHPGSPRID